MIARTTKIALEVVVGLVALAAIVTGVLVWRLSQGPVELDFLTPRLEQALSEGSGAYTVEVGGTVLAWEGWPETFALRLQDITVRANGDAVAEVPEVDLKLSLTALVRGTVAPTEVSGRGVRLVVVRGADGFRLRSAPATAAAQADTSVGTKGVDQVLPALLDDLMAAPTPDSALSYLERLQVTDAAVVVRDEVLGIVWHAPDADIQLRRAPGGIDGVADLTLQLGERRLTVDAGLGYARGGGEIDVVANFDDLRPADLAAQVPQLAGARNITVPLSGNLSATLALSGEVVAASANLKGGAGELTWPTYLPDPRPVQGLSARAHYTSSGQLVRLEKLEVQFGETFEPDAAADAETVVQDPTGGPLIAASGTARGVGAGPTELEAQLSVQGLDLDELGHYWPHELAVNARPWVVENIRTGRAQQAELTAHLTIPEAGFDAVELHELSGTMAYSDLDVHYLRPLPPVRSVDGTATFDAGSLRLNASGGVLNALRVPRADIDITGLDTTSQNIAIDLDLNGPLHDALAVLDQPRLDLMAPLGLDPDSVGGRIDTARLRFRFPLIDELTFDGTQVNAEAQLESVSVADFVLGQDATDGRLQLAVDKAGMHVEGPVELAGVPLTMTWRENFEESEAVATVLEATVPNLDTEDRARLGLDTRPFVTGPLSTSVIFRSYRDGGGLLNAAVNLGDAAIDLPFAAWRKPAGEPGTANASLRLQDGTPRALETFTLRAGGQQVDPLAATGAARFSEDGAAVQQMELAQFRLGRTDLEGMTAEKRDEAWHVQLRAGVLDLQRLLDDALLSGDGPEEAPGPALEVATSQLQRVYFGPERYVDDVTLRARRDADGWWRQFYLAGRAPARFEPAARPDESLPAPDADATAAPFEVDYGPGSDGRRQLRVTAQDSGAMLRALNIFDTLEGGQMTITGQARGPEPDSPIDARVRVADFRLVNVPTLARILTVASFTGINNLLQGDGISFDRLEGNAVYDRGTLSTDLLHAYGPALGLTTKGEVDLDAGQLDLTGVVVPAASTNRVLADIPVLGKLLTGGEGEGLFAVTYDVTGPLDKPEVGVNPLSALAPGFLRGLFGRIGDLESQEPPEDWPKARPDE